jgi:hypothetical protein
MASQHPSRETLGQLALSCSALARAGQILSTVHDPDQAGKALLQAAAILEDDLRTSGWLQIGDLAAECRAAADSNDGTGLIEVCRRLATKLARQASTLATEVRQQSKRAAAPTAPPTSAVPVPSIGPAAAAAAGPPAGRDEQRSELHPVATEPAHGKRRIHDADLARVSVAVSPGERRAVLAALEAGDRFALVQGEMVIDVEHNLMWLARLGPRGPFSTALQFVTACRVGGHADWRLPRPNEIQQFLARGGRDWAAGHGMWRAGEAGAGLVTVWSNDFRWRWLLLRKEVTVVDTATGAISMRRSGSKNVGVLAVRGGA